MGEAARAALLAGFGLAGVLAVGAAWSRSLALDRRCAPPWSSRRRSQPPRASSSDGALPHLGVGAMPAVGAAIALRLTAVPPPGRVLLVVGCGALAGLVAWVVERLARRAPRAVPLQADVAVLVLLTGVAAAADPLSGLGSVPGAVTGAVGRVPAVAVLGGVLVATAGVWVCARARRLPPGVRWLLAGGASALTGALMSGAAIAAAGTPALAVAVVPVAVGLAARCAIAALLAPTPVTAALIAVGLAFVEVAITAVSGEPLAGLIAVAVLGASGLARAVPRTLAAS